MHDPAAIATALRAIRADIVAVVRGGGDAASFAVFEDSRVLEALATCPAYRVLGLGHTANRTLAELLADHAASTPAAAGVHVAGGIARIGQAAKSAGLVQELREMLATREMELTEARRPMRFELLEQPSVPDRALEEPDARGEVPERRLLVPALGWIALGAGLAWVVIKVLL